MSEEFDIETETPEVRFGTYLRRERELRRVELSYVSDYTRLGIDRITDLESGNWEVFGAEVYIRGAVSNYARAIGLDPEDILLRLDSDVPNFQPENQLGGYSADNPIFRADRAEASRSLGPLLGKVAVAAGIAMVAMMAWLALERERQAVEQRPVAVPAPVVAPAAAVTQAAAVTAVVPATAATAASAAAPSESAEPKPTEEEAAKPEEKRWRGQLDAPPSAAKPLHTLSVRAKSESWIGYGVDDQNRVDRLISAGRTLEIRGRERIFVRVGNVGGVEVELDGINLEVTGPVGQVYQRTFSF